MSKRIIWIVTTASLASACSNANPNAPLSQQYGALNIIAVGVAVLGGLIGFGLSRRRVEPDEPRTGNKKKKSRERRK